MSFETMKLFFALAAIVANIITIALVVIGVAGRKRDDSPYAFLSGLTLWLAAGVAISATLGSLYLSEIVHLIPCKWCWFQRIFMYPLAVILPIAAFRKDKGIRIYATALAIPGLVISVYHRLLQAGVLEDNGACSASGPPCSAPMIMEFEFVTIPYMAMSAFLLILALLWANRANSLASVATSGEQPR